MDVNWEINGQEYPVEIYASPEVMIDLLDKEIDRIDRALEELDRIEKRINNGV